MCCMTGDDSGGSCTFRSGIFHIHSSQNVDDLSPADSKLDTQPVERFRRLWRDIGRDHLQVFRRTAGAFPGSAPVFFGLFHNFTNFAIN